MVDISCALRVVRLMMMAIPRHPSHEINDKKSVSIKVEDYFLQSIEKFTRLPLHCSSIVTMGFETLTGRYSSTGTHDCHTHNKCPRVTEQDSGNNVMLEVEEGRLFPPKLARKDQPRPSFFVGSNASLPRGTRVAFRRACTWMISLDATLHPLP